MNTCEELECSNDNMCSVGVVKSVAHSIKSDSLANKKNHTNKNANESGNHANVSGDRPSGSSVGDFDDNCPGKDAIGVSQVAVGDTSQVADGDTTAVAVGDTGAAVDCSGENQDVKLKESLAEIRELQLKDPDLTIYFTYLEQNVLPEDDNVAKRKVMESKRMKLIDGVLHREDVSDSSRWYVVVPCELRNDLLKEAHSCVFAGHFSERKVYDRLHRSYWWHGMRSDVRKFCRGCLNCATRKGPGRGIRPPLQPIRPFH